jgi:hypothetical protein
VEEVNIDGKQINYNKMIGAADEKSCRVGFHIKNKEYIDIQKRPEKAENEKKDIDLRFPAPHESQYGQPEKTAQSQ